MTRVLDSKFGWTVGGLTGPTISRASGNFVWSAAVAEFGMILRDSKYKGSATFTSVAELARSARGPDREGYRAEFIALVEMAESLAKQKMVARARAN